jgi:hypothetical protein
VVTLWSVQLCNVRDQIHDAEACTTGHFESSEPFEGINFFYTRVLKVLFLSFFYFFFFHEDFVIVISCVVMMQRYLTDS